MQYQILDTNITRTIWQTVRRITGEISGDKGLMMTSSMHLSSNRLYKLKSPLLFTSKVGKSFLFQFICRTNSLDQSSITDQLLLMSGKIAL